jgi:hypothetical protein
MNSQIVNGSRLIEKLQARNNSFGTAYLRLTRYDGAALAEYKKSCKQRRVPCVFITRGFKKFWRVTLDMWPSGFFLNDAGVELAKKHFSGLVTGGVETDWSSCDTVPTERAEELAFVLYKVGLRHCP